MKDSPAKRLRLFRNSLGLKQREVAERIKISTPYLTQIENGARNPSSKVLRALSEAFGVSPSWVLDGTGEMISGGAAFAGRSDRTVIQSPERDRPGHGDFTVRDTDFVMVPRMNIDVSAGRGLIAVEDEVIDHVAFSTSWMSRQGINSDLCGLVRVCGDSMAPTIRDQSLVMIHRPEMIVDRPGIYGFSRNDEAFIKRLTPILDPETGRLLALVISSDNPLYAPETVVGRDLNEIRIAGRVRASISDFN